MSHAVAGQQEKTEEKNSSPKRTFLELVATCAEEITEISDLTFLEC